MLNENKIAFVICANNDLYYKECARYLNHLHIPEGYEIDIICITGAESMAQGYNYAMNESDAKYKVYLHQDVFIYHVNFIKDILEVFHTDDKIGLIGVVGSMDLPPNAFIYNAWNAGCTYACNFASAFPFWRGEKHHNYDQKNRWEEVKAIDGMLMATQYDIGWREDIMMGWDFYDVSQSLEFLRNGYKIVVPYQKTPWCMHDCGHSKLLHYDESRERILKEYKEFFTEQYKPICDLEYLLLQEKIFTVIKEYLEQGMLQIALEIKKAVCGKEIRSNDLQYILNMLEIYVAEKDRGEESFFTDVCTWEEAKNKYDSVKFTVRYVESGVDSEAGKRFVSLIKNKNISEKAIQIIANHSTINPVKVMERIVQLVEKE